MKNYKLSLLGIALMALGSCTTEAIDATQEATSEQELLTAELQSQLDLTANTQEPAVVFDTTKEGIYHGVIASGDTQSRGKVWLNLGNNTETTATIIMTDGSSQEFTAQKTIENNSTTYTFTGDAGSFKVTESTVNKPEITNVILNEQPYFMYAIKSTSTRMAISYTGAFQETTTGGTASGTWNILANGANQPNGFGGTTALSEVIVTYNGDMETDTVFETGNFPCIPLSEWVPIANLSGEPGDGIIAIDQTSSLFGGTSSWDLIFSQNQIGGYGIAADCSPSPTTSGTFTWESATSALTRTGTILIDF